jgi:DNA-binding CsgD family transcriptional regulator
MVHALVARSDLAGATRTQLEAFQLAQEAADPVAIWVALEAGAVIARATGDFERGRRLLREARQIAIQERDDYARVRVEAPLVRLYLARAELENAQSVCAQRIHDGLGPRSTLFVLEALGWIASARGDLERATTLLSAAHSARERSGVRLFYIDDLEEHERAMARLRQLDAGHFEALWTAGGAVSLADVFAEATTEKAISRPQARRAAAPDRLTGRELQILRLIAQGSSNRDVATQLDLSVRTVERHITNIYTKIGARGKADATAYVFRHGLVSA